MIIINIIKSIKKEYSKIMLLTTAESCLLLLQQLKKITQHQGDSVKKQVI